MIRQVLAAGMCVAALAACSSTPSGGPGGTPATVAAASTAASTAAAPPESPPPSTLPLLDATSLQSCGLLGTLMDEYLGTTEVPDFTELADRLLDEVLPVAPDDLAPLVMELSRTARQQPDETEVPALLEAMQAVSSYCGFESAPG